MTCKEKIDEIEKILNDEHEVKIGRIRRIVEDAEDKAIPLGKVKQAREEIDDLDRHFDNDYFSSNNDSMFKCNEVLAILDGLISEVEIC